MKWLEELSTEEGEEGGEYRYRCRWLGMSSSSGAVQIPSLCYSASKLGLLGGLLSRSNILFLYPLFTSTASVMSRFPCVVQNIPVFLMNLNMSFIAFGCESMVAKECNPHCSVKQRSWQWSQGHSFPA
jgi:hypothetical protein